ncbi:MAG: cytochrome c maturation protein CcmE [Betaproteobacteria bacterium]|nr:cytochrome c maturation protein CcmE [Betaproteobacteria bacterium]
MKARHQRLLLIFGALATIALIAALVFSALSENIAFFYAPAEVQEGKAPKDRMFRVGGLVKEDSFSREADGVTARFVITDREADIPVRYNKPLPDLFSEGKGVVAQGKLGDDGIFIAQEVLAKHDENYMPPEAAAALAAAHSKGMASEASDESVENATSAASPETTP